jgi:hypothetical protein
MLTIGTRHAWFQAALVTAVLALLMLTDRNGDILVRALIGTAALAASIYAVVRLWRGKQPTTDQAIGLPSSVRGWMMGERKPR